MVHPLPVMNTVISWRASMVRDCPRSRPLIMWPVINALRAEKDRMSFYIIEEEDALASNGFGQEQFAHLITLFDVESHRGAAKARDYRDFG
jgi:hypothetical protein